MKVVRAIIPFPALVLCVTLAANAQEGQSDPSGTDQSQKDNQLTLSSCMERMIQSKLDSDPELKDSNLQVRVDQEKVTLSGTVKSQDQRNSAVSIAKDSAPGYQIADTIDVRPGALARTDVDSSSARQKARERGDSIGTSEEDAQIYSKIMSKMSESNASIKDVKFDVKNGNVTLRGKVPDENAKNKVYDIARQIEGVSQVNNELSVEGSRPAQ